MATTQLSPAGVPGAPYTFTAKTEAAYPVIMSVAFSETAPAVTISSASPGAAFTSKKPGATFSEVE